MKQRSGQALIIVVLIIAIVMAVFANSFTTQIRFHAREETEIYQREQALYLAEIGINQMIFNINSGITYNDGDSISNNVSGIGTYTATYHTPDNSGYGGSAYIESVGTVGSFSRKIFTSIQPGGNSSDAFKYCLYTTTGGYTKTNNGGYTTITFTNKDYGSNYYYNKNATITPYPDWNWYTNINNYQSGKFVEYDASATSATYNPYKNGDAGKVVFIHYDGDNPKATLKIKFTSNSIWDYFNGSSTIQISIITDYPKVKFVKIGEYKNTSIGWDVVWDPVYYDSNHQFPAFLHKPFLTSKSSVLFDYEDKANDTHTFSINGLLYSNSPVKFEYGGQYWGFINVRSELIAKSLTTDWDYSEDYLGYDVNNDNRMTTETIFDYDPDGHTDYYLYPPPHFIVPNGDVTKVFPGSFREEY